MKVSAYFMFLILVTPVIVYADNQSASSKVEIENNVILDFSKRSVYRLFIQKHEGVKYSVYKDAKGIATIGVGFNLHRSDACSILQKVGANCDKIKSGQAILSTYQVDKIFEYTAKESYHTARNKIGSEYFDRLGINQKIVLTSLAFNNPSLIGPDLSKHIKNKDWELAEDEIRFRSNKNGYTGIQYRRNVEADFFNDFSKFDDILIMNKCL